MRLLESRGCIAGSASVHLGGRHASEQRCAREDQSYGASCGVQRASSGSTTNDCVLRAMREWQLHLGHCYHSPQVLANNSAERGGSQAEHEREEDRDGPKIPRPLLNHAKGSFRKRCQSKNDGPPSRAGRIEGAHDDPRDENGGDYAICRRREATAGEMFVQLQEARQHNRRCSQQHSENPQENSSVSLHRSQLTLISSGRLRSNSELLGAVSQHSPNTDHAVVSS